MKSNLRTGFEVTGLFSRPLKRQAGFDGKVPSVEAPLWIGKLCLPQEGRGQVLVFPGGVLEYEGRFPPLAENSGYMSFEWAQRILARIFFPIFPISCLW